MTSTPTYRIYEFMDKRYVELHWRSGTMAMTIDQARELVSVVSSAIALAANPNPLPTRTKEPRRVIEPTTPRTTRLSINTLEDLLS